MTVKTYFVYNSYFFRKKILKIDLFLHSLHVSTPLRLFSMFFINPKIIFLFSILESGSMLRRLSKKEHTATLEMSKSYNSIINILHSRRFGHHLTILSTEIKIK